MNRSRWLRLKNRANLQDEHLQLDELLQGNQSLVTVYGLIDQRLGSDEFEIQVIKRLAYDYLNTTTSF